MVSAARKNLVSKKSKRSLTRMAKFDPLVRRMYAYYRRGHTLKEVAKKFGRGGKYPEGSVHHLFKHRGLQCRQPCESIDFKANGLKHRAKLDALVARMHKDYVGGMSLQAVGKKYDDRGGQCVRELFTRRGLKVRHWACSREYDPSTGCFIGRGEPSPAEIDEIIKRSGKIERPSEIRYQWDGWSLEKRGQFIARSRELLKLQSTRPAAPFSANVEPFNYASARAHQIAEAMNAGATSRHRPVKVRAASEGVIWNNQLWFWHPKVGYQQEPWTPKFGRPSLHKTIWEKSNGCKMPAGHVIRHADGNRNNFDPSNLVLATRNDVCRENQAAALAAKSRAITALLLTRQQKGKPHDHTNTIAVLRRVAK